MIDESLAGVDLSGEGTISSRASLHLRSMPGVSQRQQPGYRWPQRFFLRGKSKPQCQGSGSPQAAGGRGPQGSLAGDTGTMRQHQRAIQELGCICCSTLDVICRIGTRVPDGRAPGGPNAFCLCSSPGRRARLLAAAVSLRGLMSARGAW